MQHSPIPATALRGGIRRKEGWRGRKGPSMNLKVLLPGKLSNGEAQLAWLGFKLETRSMGWGMRVWTLWSPGLAKLSCAK